MIELAPEFTDERLGLPSISAFEQMAKCPGSYHAQKGLPDLDDTAIRQQGTDIHSVMAGEMPEKDLPSSLRWILDRTMELEMSICDTAFPQYERSELEELAEQRYWFLDSQGNKLYSGKLDKVYLDPEHSKAVVIDYKFGFKRVLDAKKNRQIRGGVVLLANSYLISDVMGAIIQPRIAGDDALLLCQYSGEQIQEASQKNLTLVARAMDVNAPRNPGVTQCEYCKAKPTCKPAIEYFTSKSKEIIGILDLPIVETKPKTVKDAYSKLPSARRKEIAELWPLVKVMGDCLNEDNKRFLESGKSIPGFSLGNGKESRVITNPLTLLQQLVAEIGRPLSTEEVSEFLSCPVGKVEDFYVKETNKSPNEFNERFSEVIDYKKSRGSIQRVAN
jgi:hypothetical protein